ncbi:PREDICTED: uncharacterized protein LOC108748415 [Trachymyrmex septentrionalis]|uniref:uncharacterized protein LOC108748415 n=1 Tax=Trachymyrmex septentrionalis TaxID=34720 RepID=UPI00084F0E2F|nr:PREDICTED: uncharacterized protein LOC108748415 [Trachymyrmex septentrionalis]
MSKNKKIDYFDNNNDQEDIQWFENYEKKGTKHLERLKNEDILNYIKDVEQNCRLEISSGDEDYAGTKKSSNCSVRCSGTRFKSLKKVKSRVTRKNKNITLKRKTKRSSDHNTTRACNYCCSAGEFHFHSNPDFTVEENSRRNLNTFTKSAYQHPNLSKNSYKHQATLPTFHGWYSRENRKGWPKMASLEVIKNRSQNAIHNSRNNKSKITDRKSANVHTFKSLRREKLDDSTYKSYPSITSNEKTTERNSRYSDRKQEREIRIKKLNKESDISDFDGDYDRYYTSKYPVRRPRQPTTWDLSSRSNRLTELARLPERSSLLQRQTSQWVNKMGPPLKAFNSIIGASIDRSYHREMKHKNNMNQQRRNPNVLGEREPSCYCRPGLLKESGKLCQVVRTDEDKQWLDYSCENAEQDETMGYLRCCSENVNDFIRPQYESRPSTMNKRANYTTLRRTLSESVQSQYNDEGESEFNLSMAEDSQIEEYDNNAFDVFDDARNIYDDAIDVKYLKPRVSFPGDPALRDSNEVAREYKKSNNDLKRNQGKSMATRTTLQNKITTRYPKNKKSSFATRKPVSGDSPELRYDAAESTCECKEPFHDSPACLTGSYTCIGNDENAKRNDSDSSRRISHTVYNCCCSCSSSTSHDEKDPVKKLESFCERVKAVNQDIFHKSSKSTCRKLTRTNAQEYVHSDSDEQNQSEFSTQRVNQRARSTEGEQLANHACLRLKKHSHDGDNLDKIFIYPPRGENGPPLTLYKRSSNISCRVKGDADTGFRYSVTYVQKFVSPSWMPSLTPEDPSWEIDEGYSCSADYG